MCLFPTPTQRGTAFTASSRVSDAGVPYTFAVVAVNAANRSSTPSQRSNMVVPCAVAHTSSPGQPPAPTTVGVPYGVAVQWSPPVFSECYAGSVLAWNVSYTVVFAASGPRLGFVVLPGAATSTTISTGADCTEPDCSVLVQVACAAFMESHVDGAAVLFLALFS